MDVPLDDDMRRLLALTLPSRWWEEEGPAKRPRAPAQADALLVDYREAARLLGLSVAALQQRVHVGSVPSRVIKRTGRRVQFIRSALESWASKGGR